MSGKWLLLALISALFLMIGCESDSDPVDVSIIVEGTAKVGETVTITVDSKSALVDYQWTLVDELGNKITSCDAFNVDEINCTLEVGGEAAVRLQAKTRDGDDFDKFQTFNILDMDKPLDQAPMILLSLSSATVIQPAVVSTVLDKQAGVANFPVGESVKFDFSGTTDDTTGDLKYEIQIGQDTGFQTVQSVYNHTFDTVGFFTIDLRVTDAKNNISKKSFVAYVSCSDSGPTHYDLVVDPSKITITPGTLRNFFVYNGSSAVTGGDATKYQYKWDYNGDGIFDSNWLKPEDLTNGGIEDYTVYGGARNVSMKVWDTKCNYVKQVTFEHDFNAGNDNMTLTDATPGKLQKPQIGAYFFIQGIFAGIDGFKSVFTDVPFIATKHDSSPPEEQWRVLCDYRVDQDTHTATISIKGLNFYKRGNGLENENENNVDGQSHGLLMTLNDLDVSGFSDGTTSSLPNIKGNVEKLSYYTDEGRDSLTGLVYRKDGNCVTQVTIEVTRAEGSCSGAPTYSDVIIIDGTYSCDKLTDTTDGNSFSVNEGAFYCEVGKADACYGGGLSLIHI